nr:hypothetical protein GCM10020185_59860 [Pseudomonas brassicacearum subsp. brassicacearum]
MGAAFELAAEAFDEELAKIARLRNRLLEPLLALPGVRINGSASRRIPHTLSLTFNEGEFNPATLGASIAFFRDLGLQFGAEQPVPRAAGLGARCACGRADHSLEPGPLYH